MYNRNKTEILSKVSVVHFFVEFEAETQNIPCSCIFMKIHRNVYLPTHSIALDLGILGHATCRTFHRTKIFGILLS